MFEIILSEKKNREIVRWTYVFHIEHQWNQMDMSKKMSQPSQDIERRSYMATKRIHLLLKYFKNFSNLS